MTVLAVNIGNTHIAVGCWNESSWQGPWYLSTDVKKTSFEYLTFLQALLDISCKACETIIVSSVVPQITQTLCTALSTMLKKKILLVSSNMHTGLSQAPSSELGHDLLANAVAAFHLNTLPAVIVDCGTALSLTTVSKSGAIEGVCIAPGLTLAVSSLSTSAAQIYAVDLSSTPTSVLGKTTEHAIQAGIVHGYVGLVEHLVGKIARELGTKVKVLGTGGGISFLAPHSKIFDRVDPLHTLNGLRILAELNSTAV